MAANKGGGIAHHKSGCRCTPCVRKAKALALAAGVPESALAPPPRKAKGKVTIPGPNGAPIEVDIIETEGRSIRDRISQWLVLRQQEPGITNAEVAKRIGLATSTLNAYISTARKQGWLSFIDPLSRMEHEIIPMTLDNLAFYLSKEGGRDKQTTIEVFKGTIAKDYEKSKGIGEGPQTVLALKIESVSHDQSKVLTGHVVGAPRLVSPANQSHEEEENESHT